MELRKARMVDVVAMHVLINSHAEKGLMLPRSRNALYEGVREFTVAIDQDVVVGCGSLHVIWEDLAEIRSLAVADDYAHRGLGSQLVTSLLKEAVNLGIPRIFVLTYVPEFFSKCGFRPACREELPQKVWKECINCPKFPDCDEIAMLLEWPAHQLNLGITPAV